MDSIVFTIDMNPVPKGRPRFGNGHAYTPKATLDYEKYVAAIAGIYMRGEYFETELLALTIHFRRKGKRLCDIDNLIKAFLDAGNGVIWKDDTQIRQITARLDYGHDTGETRIEISVLPESRK